MKGMWAPLCHCKSTSGYILALLPGVPRKGICGPGGRDSDLGP